MRARVTDLGNSVTALFRFESMDLGDTKGVSNTVKHLDEVYGPISHVFVVCGIPAHLTEHPDAWKLVGVSESFWRIDGVVFNPV